ECTLPADAVLTIVVDVVVPNHTVSEVRHSHGADVSELVVLDAPAVDGLECVVCIRVDYAAAELLEDEVLHRYRVTRSACIADQTAGTGRRFHHVSCWVIGEVNGVV